MYIYILVFNRSIGDGAPHDVGSYLSKTGVLLLPFFLSARYIYSLLFRYRRNYTRGFCINSNDGIEKKNSSSFKNKFKKRKNGRCERGKTWTAPDIITVFDQQELVAAYYARAMLKPLLWILQQQSVFPIYLVRVTIFFQKIDPTLSF